MVESAGEGSEASEQELREQLEQQVRELRVEDLVLQSAVSVLNLAARRIGKEDERDLDQAKAGIEAAGGLLDYVPEDARPQLRQAVSELQLLWAKHASGGGEDAEGEGGRGAEEGGEAGAGAGSEDAAGDAKRVSGAAAKAASEQGKGDQGGRKSGLWIPGDG